MHIMKTKTQPTRPLPKGRLWAMRLAAMVLIPGLFLGGLEWMLRVTGFGYPTSFFLPATIDGKAYLVPNYRFSYLFFPEELARVPPLYRIPAEKPEGTYRIFLFGESAALGDPEPGYGMGRQLEVLLAERFPGTEFEVICVALTAINSHVILPIARECAGLDGDLWVVYMGNNEMVGPFGAGTVFGSRAPGLAFVRTAVALKATRIGQLLARMAPQPEISGAPEGRWGGIEMFRENPLRENDAGRLKAYENFAGNLDDIVKAGRKSGVPVILSSVASNLKDCSPFISLHAENLSNGQRDQWDAHYSAGKEYEEREDFEAALKHYQKAADIGDAFAELHFRTGTCLLGLSRSTEAMQAFERARDLDALAVRADGRINGIIRAAGENDPQVIGINALEHAGSASKDSIPGNRLFFEHVHFTPAGNFLMAKAIGDEIIPLLPEAIAASDPGEWPHKDTVLRHLGLTVWDQNRLWQTALQRVGVPPFTGQTTHRRSVRHIREGLIAINKGITIETPWRDRNIYRSALERSPDDPVLVGNYAQFLEGTGDRADAIEQARRFRDLLPVMSWPHYYLGALLQAEGRLAEARQCFEQALEIRGEFELARQSLNEVNRELVNAEGP